MTNPDEPRPRERGSLKRALRATAITVGLTVALFVLLEGVSGLGLFVWRMGQPTGRGGTGWRHTQPDEELGWVHRPDLEITELYGPGGDFVTNSQGFRNRVDFSVAEPAGKVRVICSGDSFTLGFGVGNDESWCAQLGRIDPRIETINMGQIAYGVGQVYLWYMRDGRTLDHSVHIIGLISADIERMMRDDFRGVSKPRVAVQDGELVVRNVPLHQPSGFQRWAAKKSPDILDLRTIRVLQGLWWRVGRREPAARRGPSLPDSISREVLSGVLASLVAENEANGRTLVVVYHVVRGDLCCARSERSRQWRAVMAEEAERQGFVLIDLVPVMREYSAREILDMFISGRPGRGHYSTLGNEIVAKKVYQRLAALPELSGRLSSPVP